MRVHPLRQNVEATQRRVDMRRNMAQIYATVTLLHLIASHLVIDTRG